MKVLVTGGAGYIGSHTVKELLKEGFEVVVLDNLSSGKKELLLGGHFIEGDLMDPSAVESAFRSFDIGGVLHFASLIQVGESYRDPQKYYRHNVTSALNLLQGMLKAGVKRFVFSSSAAVYGEPEHLPIPETHPLRPSNPYGRTKVMVENILRDYAEAYGLKSISLRYFNAAGADPEGRLGEMHEPETHLIPNILLFLLRAKSEFFLYGTDFPTPDGTAIRDFVHVTDLARAHVLALKKLEEIPKTEYFNLGTNRGYSVLEVLQKVEEVTGRNVVYTPRPRRPGDVAILQASKEKAEQDLGWKARLSDLGTIVETAWKWHQNHVPKGDR